MICFRKDNLKDNFQVAYWYSCDLDTIQELLNQTTLIKYI